jgi:hypothetical protein
MAPVTGFYWVWNNELTAPFVAGVGFEMVKDPSGNKVVKLDLRNGSSEGGCSLTPEHACFDCACLNWT